MGKNLEITEKLEKYINNFSLKLNPIQQEIIDYNNTLGDVKRMQVATSQCHFLHLIIKISNVKNVLEIGTFTGLSAGADANTVRISDSTAVCRSFYNSKIFSLSDIYALDVSSQAAGLAIQIAS